MSKEEDPHIWILITLSKGENMFATLVIWSARTEINAKTGDLPSRHVGQTSSSSEEE